MNSENSEAVFTSTAFGGIEKYIKGIEEILPVDNDDYFVSKIYRIFKALADSPDEEKTWLEVGLLIDSRLERVTEIIEEYRQMEVHPQAVETHLRLRDAFLQYHEGLSELEVFLSDGDGKIVPEAFNLIFQGDQLLLEVENDIVRLVDETPIDLFV
ncbi:MAG: hypothetical protein K8T10_12180 [Candidatus Eremiobacteraeota bacterium]|nr:hypothetical protein [Candidatus Eremiobacteraeota bacterium]